MPTISGTTTIQIGATIPNLFLGSQYELMPFDGTIEFGIMSNRDTVDMSMFSGPDVLAEPGSAVPFVAGTAAMPRYPDDYHWEDEAAQGDRLKVTVHNGNAAIAIVNWALRITPA